MDLSVDDIGIEINGFFFFLINSLYIRNINFLVDKREKRMNKQ